MSQKKLFSAEGFTLFELIVTVVAIGILVTILLLSR